MADGAVLSGLLHFASDVAAPLARFLERAYAVLQQYLEEGRGFGNLRPAAEQECADTRRLAEREIDFGIGQANIITHRYDVRGRLLALFLRRLAGDHRDIGVERYVFGFGLDHLQQSFRQSLAVEIERADHIHFRSGDIGMPCLAVAVLALRRAPAAANAALNFPCLVTHHAGRASLPVAFRARYFFVAVEDELRAPALRTDFHALPVATRTQLGALAIAALAFQFAVRAAGAAGLMMHIFFCEKGQLDDFVAGAEALVLALGYFSNDFLFTVFGAENFQAVAVERFAHALWTIDFFAFGFFAADDFFHRALAQGKREGRFKFDNLAFNFLGRDHARI